MSPRATRPSRSRSAMVGSPNRIIAPILRATATSNDPWGPVGSDMAEIAQITFNK